MCREFLLEIVLRLRKYKVPGTNQHMLSPLISMCRAYYHIQHNTDIFNCLISQLTNTLRNIP